MCFDIESSFQCFKLQGATCVCRATDTGAAGCVSISGIVLTYYLLRDNGNAADIIMYYNAKAYKS